MKYFLIIILIACSTYIGWGFSKYYVNRKNFFKEFVLLLDKLKLDISFSKDKITDIISGYDTKNKQIKTLLNNFLIILETGNFEDDLLFKNINILKDDEKNNILLFFKSLGRFDMDNQTKQIEAFKQEFTVFEKNATSKNDKFGSLFVKLGFIVGILISLLVV